MFYRANGDTGLEYYDSHEVVENWYGADVLQSTEMFITDVDDKTDESLARITKVSQSLSFPCLVFETVKGFRVLNPFHKTRVSESISIQEEMGAEEYVRLCKEQDTYRARLTPKPWRVELQVCRLKLDLSMGYSIDHSLKPQLEIHRRAEV